MMVKHMATGLALMGTIVANLAGGAPVARATCHACRVQPPSIAISSVSADALNIAVTGSNFPAGSAVHLDLVRAVGTPTTSGPPVDAQLAASTDTQASYPFSVPLGNGQFVQYPGGRIWATLNEDYPGCGYFSFWLIATNSATGKITTSAPNGTDQICN